MAVDPIATAQRHRSSFSQILQAGLNCFAHRLLFASLQFEIGLDQAQAFLQDLIGVVKLAGADQTGYQSLLVFAEHDVDFRHPEILIPDSLWGLDPHIEDNKSAIAFYTQQTNLNCRGVFPLRPFHSSTCHGTIQSDMGFR
jgi:hypothetical protein